mmetsp:Transcript_27836/g.46308  ORF Transcript_27836/g.46308 Transcript_27836/m.46308 type:complete len:195 (+) Transcript_27836:35-619(+)
MQTEEAVAAKAVAVGGPVVVKGVNPVPYERIRKRAKVFGAIAGGALTLVAGWSIFDHKNQNCNVLFVCVVMGWLSIFGILLVLAELDVKFVHNYFHILAYRSGRASVGIFAGTICMSAAPSELALGATGLHMEGSYVVQVQWEFLVLGVFLIAASIYNIRVSSKAKANQLNKNRNKLPSGSHKEDSSSKPKELM